MTKLIKNGTVVSATGRHAAEVLVDGATIVALLQPGSDTALAAEAGAEARYWSAKLTVEATGETESRYLSANSTEILCFIPTITRAFLFTQLN